MRVDHEPSSRAGAFPAGACAVHVQYQGYSRAGALYPAACTAWLGGSARDARGLLTTAYGPLAGPSSTNPHYARVRRHARQKSSGRSGPGATALEPETVPPARLRLQSAPPARSVSGPWRAGQTLAWIDAPPARVLAPRQWLAPPTPPPPIRLSLYCTVRCISTLARPPETFVATVHMYWYQLALTVQYLTIQYHRINTELGIQAEIEYSFVVRTMLYTTLYATL